MKATVERVNVTEAAVNMRAAPEGFTAAEPDE
jgi:hypothetical protein